MRFGRCRFGNACSVLIVGYVVVAVCRLCGCRLSVGGYVVVVGWWLLVGGWCRLSVVWLLSVGGWWLSVGCRSVVMWQFAPMRLLEYVVGRQKAKRR